MSSGYTGFIMNKRQRWRPRRLNTLLVGFACMLALIIAMGLPPEAVKRVVKLIKISEYKRRQSAVGIRITPRGFGRDWRYPITSKWREWEHIDDR